MLGLQFQTVELGIGIFLAVLFLMLTSTLVKTATLNSVENASQGGTRETFVPRIYWFLIAVAALSATSVLITPLNTALHCSALTPTNICLLVYSFLVFRRRPLLSIVLYLTAMVLFLLLFWNLYVLHFDNTVCLLAMMLALLGIGFGIILIRQLKT